MSMIFIKDKINKILILIFLILGFYSCSDNNEDPIQVLPVSEIKNIAYGVDSDQIFNVYLPAGRSKLSTKTFVLVHGGSWISGDKNDISDFVTILKFNFPEYAIVNMNYRLASFGNPPFPMQTDDIQSVLDHLENNSEEYQIRQKYAFLGVSAGAHLSMLYAYKYDTNTTVDMVCSIVGPTNFTDTNYVDNPNYANFITAIQLMTGESITENPAYYEGFSPLHVVTESAPPTILFYGGKDDLVPTSQGIEMNDKLSELNVEHEFTLYENEGHGWTGTNSIDTSTKLVNFINLHF